MGISTAERATTRRPRSTWLAQGRCTGRWAWPSGWRRQTSRRRDRCSQAHERQHLERNLEAERGDERVPARGDGVGIDDVLDALLRRQPAGELREIRQLERHLRGPRVLTLLALALDVLGAVVGGRHAAAA